MFPTESFWNEKFAGNDYFYGTEPNEFLRLNLKFFPKNAKVLALGEGEGRNAIFVAGEGHSVTASDASAKGLEKLQKLAKEKGVEVTTRHEDVISGEWEKESWEVIYNIFCHLPETEREKLYAKIKKSLSPGGIFLTEMFSKEQLNYQSGGPPVFEMLLTLEELEKAFADFQILYSAKEIVELDEGRHQGLGSVVRFIAKKND